MSLLKNVSNRITQVRFRRNFRLTRTSLEAVLASQPDLQLDLSCWHQDLRAGGFRDTAVFAALVRARRPRQYFEIGTGFGRTATLAALNTPSDAVINTICIDYLDNPQIGWIFRGHPLESKIVARKADSMTFDYGPYENRMEFVFVDGAHDYEHVASDTEVAFRLVAPGGWILWHDVTMECPGVVEALQSSPRATEIAAIENTAYACHKDTRGSR